MSATGMAPGDWSKPSGSSSARRGHPVAPPQATGVPTMRAAIYARVSTGRQERDQTIDSQVTALWQWARTNGHDLPPERIFTDEGYTGARLDRPGLDRLRDAARE